MTFQVEMDKLIKEKRLYFLGDSLPPDWYAAFKIWLPMAEAGDPKAQYNVGRCYKLGEGVDKDPGVAKHWYLKAAEQNDARALFNLYLFYSDGKDEKKDFEKAEGYLKKAVELGEKRALDVMSARALEFEKQKIKLAEEEKARQFEAKKNDFLKVNGEICNLLAPLFLERKFEEAKQLISQVKDERLLWVREYIDYVDIHILSVKHTSFIDTKYIENGGFTGTIGPSGNFTGTKSYSREHTRKYQVELKIKNNSSRDLRIEFGGEYHGLTNGLSSYVSRFIKMGATETLKIEGPAIIKYFEPVKHPKEPFQKIYKFDESHYKDGKFNAYHDVIIDGEKVSYEKMIMRFGLEKELKIRPPEEDKCFVLTACYGDEDHPVVKSFRAYRDDYLLSHLFGKKLVAIYYKFGPIAAGYIQNKPRIMAILREVFVGLAKLLPKKKNHD